MSTLGPAVVSVGPLRLPCRPRPLTVTAALAGLVVGVTLLGLTLGQVALPLADVTRALVGLGDPATSYVVLELRLPRALAGLLVGAALGLAGALTQTFARNPLATPDVLGVTGGAAAGAVGAIVLGGGTYAVTGGLIRLGIPVAALLGALLAAGAVYGLTWRGGVDGYRLVLVGIGCQSVLAAVTSWLLVRSSLSDAAQASVWLAGSLSARTWDHVVPVALGLAVLVPAALALRPALSVAALDDDSARSLGLRLQTSRLATVAVAVGLSAVAVAAAGPVGFVALVAPQVALRLTRGHQPPLLAAALAGALLVQTADLASRTLVPWEVPVGLTTTLLGAPYLIWLLVRHRQEVSA